MFTPGRAASPDSWPRRSPATRSRSSATSPRIGCSCGALPRGGSRCAQFLEVDVPDAQFPRLNDIKMFIDRDRRRLADGARGVAGARRRSGGAGASARLTSSVGRNSDYFRVSSQTAGALDPSSSTRGDRDQPASVRLKRRSASGTQEQQDEHDRLTRRSRSAGGAARSADVETRQDRGRGRRDVRRQPARAARASSAEALSPPELAPRRRRGRRPVRCRARPRTSARGCRERARSPARTGARPRRGGRRSASSSARPAST